MRKRVCKRALARRDGTLNYIQKTFNTPEEVWRNIWRMCTLHTPWCQAAGLNWLPVIERLTHTYLKSLLAASKFSWAHICVGHFLPLKNKVVISIQWTDCVGLPRKCSHTLLSHFSFQGYTCQLTCQVWFSLQCWVGYLKHRTFGQKGLKCLWFALYRGSLWPYIGWDSSFLSVAVTNVMTNSNLGGGKSLLPLKCYFTGCSSWLREIWAGTRRQKLWKNAICWLAFWVMLSYFS